MSDTPSSSTSREAKLIEYYYGPKWNREWLNINYKIWINPQQVIQILQKVEEWLAEAGAHVIDGDSLYDILNEMMHGHWNGRIYSPTSQRFCKLGLMELVQKGRPSIYRLTALAHELLANPSRLKIVRRPSGNWPTHWVVLENKGSGIKPGDVVIAKGKTDAELQAEEEVRQREVQQRIEKNTHQIEVNTATIGELICQIEELKSQNDQLTRQNEELQGSPTASNTRVKLQVVR